jgi:hypothetical protein
MNVQFCEICGYKKSLTKKIFHPSLLLLFLDPGSGINIPDPQHWLKLMFPSKAEHHDCARPESLNLMLLSLAITSGSAREQRWSSIRFDWNLHPVSLISG